VVITAVIVGGVSFAGGEGGRRAMLGCLLLEVIGGAVVSWNIDPNTPRSSPARSSSSPSRPTRSCTASASATRR